MDYYVTAERLEELKKELEELRTTKRIEIAKRLKRAKELGDLSENSEYQEAREEQSQVERHIFDLEQMVKNAMLIEHKKGSGAGKVQIGSTLEVTNGKQTRSFTIVGSNEANPVAGLISNESPLGSAFLGCAVGEKVKVKVPAGVVEYTITKVE